MTERHWSYDLKVGDFVVYRLAHVDQVFRVTSRPYMGNVRERVDLIPVCDGGGDFGNPTWQALPFDDAHWKPYDKIVEEDKERAMHLPTVIRASIQENIEELTKSVLKLSSLAATTQSLNDLRDEAHAIAKSKGWHEAGDAEARFPELMVMVHAEASEAVEAYRNGKAKDVIGTELADIIIRILDICGLYSIDIDRLLRAKMEHNKTRPYRHGGKLV